MVFNYNAELDISIWFFKVLQIFVKIEGLPKVGIKAIDDLKWLATCLFIKLS